MPYSGPSDPSLPSNVKKMPGKKRRAWVNIWNSAYASCIKNKSKPITSQARQDCEGRAFRIANGTVKKMHQGGTMPDEFFYVELAHLTAGKAFDALVPGTFIDMLGRKVTFKKSELQKYLKNTLEAIQANKTESGEVVGLPIDAHGHDKGDGAGWIVDATLEDGKLRLVPKWTEVGRDLIQKGIRRLFSPTVDTGQKVILGGTLTNWPATRNKKGLVLLRPIELEMGEGEEPEQTDLLYIDEDSLELEDSLDQVQQSVRAAFREQFLPKREKEMVSEPWIIEVFEDYAIVRDGGKHFSASFSMDKGKIKFENKSKWKEVKRTWVEAALERLNDTADFIKSLFSGSEEESLDEEVISMELTKEELMELIGSTVRAEMQQSAEQDLTPDDNADGDEPEGDDAVSQQQVTLLQLLEMEGLSEEYKKAISESVSELFEQSQEVAAKEAAYLIADVRKKANVSDFSMRITGGSEDQPRGINTDHEQMTKFILAQSPDNAKYIQTLLTQIVEGDAIVEFEEVGHGKKQHGSTPLPELVQEKLKAGEMKVSDLDDPILGLGDLSEYDLSAYEDKE